MLLIRISVAFCQRRSHKTFYSSVCGTECSLEESTELAGDGEMGIVFE